MKKKQAKKKLTVAGLDVKLKKVERLVGQICDALSEQDERFEKKIDHLTQCGGELSGRVDRQIGRINTLSKRQHDAGEAMDRLIKACDTAMSALNTIRKNTNNIISNELMRECEHAIAKAKAQTQ